MEQPPIPPLIKDEVYRQQTECPSCGRFIGVYERCPYCLALTPKRLSIRVFKVISVLTSTVGLLILLFYAQTIQTPEVKIADLGPLSNFAHVRLVGEVERSYGIHKQWKSLAFTLSQPGKDGELMTIRVSAYAKVAKEIEERNLVPADGDLVSVEGTVRFQKDSPSLLINAPEHLRIVRRATAQVVESPLAPAQVTRDHLGKTVTVRGKIGRAINFPRGTILGFEELPQGFCLWLPEGIRDALAGKVRQGDVVEGTGKVKMFKSQLELEIAHQSHLKVITPGEGPALPMQPNAPGQGGTDDEEGPEESEPAPTGQTSAPPSEQGPASGPAGAATNPGPATEPTVPPAFAPSPSENPIPTTGQRP